MKTKMYASLLAVLCPILSFAQEDPTAAADELSKLLDSGSNVRLKLPAGEASERIEKFAAELSLARGRRIQVEEVSSETARPTPARSSSEEDLILFEAKPLNDPWQKIQFEAHVETGSNVFSGTSPHSFTFVFPWLLRSPVGGGIQALKGIVRVTGDLSVGGYGYTFEVEPFRPFLPNSRVQLSASWRYFNIREVPFGSKEAGELQSRQSSGLFAGARVKLKKSTELYVMAGRPDWNERVYSGELDPNFPPGSCSGDCRLYNPEGSGYATVPRTQHGRSSFIVGLTHYFKR